MLIDNQPRSGRPSTSRTDENVLKICEIVLENRRRIIEEFVEVNQEVMKRLQNSANHNNESAHIAHTVLWFLTKNGMAPVPLT